MARHWVDPIAPGYWLVGIRLGSRHPSETKVWEVGANEWVVQGRGTYQVRREEDYRFSIRDDRGAGLDPDGPTGLNIIDAVGDAMGWDG